MRSAIRALVFDVLGTVVDEDRSTREAVRVEFAAAGLGDREADVVSRAWLAGMEEELGSVVAGEAPWASNDVLRRQSLDAALDGRLREAVGQDAVERLATVGHRLDAWPEAPAALDRLARGHTLVALTNGDLAQTVDMSAHAGLRWHCVLTGDAIQAFKPQAEMYALPIERLGLEPDRTLFVAAHAWDLRAAGSHGYRTCFVARRGAEREGGDFDMVVADLRELADALPTGC